MKYIRLYEDIESGTFNKYGKIKSGIFIIFSNRNKFASTDEINELIFLGKVEDFDNKKFNTTVGIANIYIMDYIQKYQISSYDLNFKSVFSTMNSISGNYFTILHTSKNIREIQKLFNVIVQEKEEQWEIEKSINKYNI